MLFAISLFFAAIMFMYTIGETSYRVGSLSFLDYAYAALWGFIMFFAWVFIVPIFLSLCVPEFDLGKKFLRACERLFLFVGSKVRV